MPATLAIGLGANLPSPAGDPLDTLVAVRPLLAQRLAALLGQPLQPHWSPLFRTAPVGGPPDQPDYANAVLLVGGVTAPTVALAERVLAELQQLEQCFGRERRERWGPRSLDLDLLWWDALVCNTPRLQLPHPLWAQRGFVLEPLRAMGVALGLPQPAASACLEPLPPRCGWPEGA